MERCVCEHSASAHLDARCILILCYGSLRSVESFVFVYCGCCSEIDNTTDNSYQSIISVTKASFSKDFLDLATG